MKPNGLAYVMLALAGPVVTVVTAGQGPSLVGNAENGKKLFTTYYCFACHGTAGQGGSAGARLVPRPASPDALIRYVRKPTGNMPPYTSKVISDLELADIQAFLRSIPPSPAAKSIPLLIQ